MYLFLVPLAAHTRASSTQGGVSGTMKITNGVVFFTIYETRDTIGTIYLLPSIIY